MIAYTANGRISGVWIVRRLLSERLIFAGNGDVVFRSGKRSLRGLQFSEELKSDLDIMEDFRTVARNVLYLYAFAEGQEYLRVPGSEIAQSFREAYLPGDISGISLLQMVSDGDIRIFFDDEETVLFAEGDFLDAVPNAEELLGDFVRTLYLFGGETVPERILVRRKQKIDTKELSPDLSISYGEDSFSSGSPGSELAYLYIEDEELPENELPPLTEEVESTLLKLRQMIQDIDDASDTVNEDVFRSELTFDEGKNVACGPCSVMVPDGFFGSADPDGSGCRIWLPNPENPDEWEASLFSARISALPENDGKETGSSENLDGRVFRTEYLIRQDGQQVQAEVRIIGVSEDTLDKARGAAGTLIRHITLQPLLEPQQKENDE